MNSEIAARQDRSLEGLQDANTSVFFCILNLWLTKSPQSIEGPKSTARSEQCIAYIVGPKNKYMRIPAHGNHSIAMSTDQHDSKDGTLEKRGTSREIPS